MTTATKHTKTVAEITLNGATYYAHASMAPRTVHRILRRRSLMPAITSQANRSHLVTGDARSLGPS